MSAQSRGNPNTHTRIHISKFLSIRLSVDTSTTRQIILGVTPTLKTVRTNPIRYRHRRHEKKCFRTDRHVGRQTYKREIVRLRKGDSRRIFDRRSAGHTIQSTLATRRHTNCYAEPQTEGWSGQ